MSRRASMAALQLALGLLVLGGIWVALPARWLVVDVLGTVVGASALVAALGLASRRGWGVSLARVVTWLELVAGASSVSALVMSVAHLAGAYGPVGSGGALLMGVIALLVLPYLVLLPVLQLSWLRDLG